MISVLDLKIEDMLSLRWEEYANNPIIEPPFPSPILADPSFLPPGRTPDGLWHLFAHSIMGIHHFTSRDGLAWEREEGVVSRKSLRPFLFEKESTYYLFYERYVRLLPYLSQIEARHSKDLYSWSEPEVVLRPTLSWQKEGCRYGAVSNPSLVEEEGDFRLYYSAGLIHMKDCRFSEPKYIGVATYGDIIGEYQAAPEPLIQPSAMDPYCNMGAGAVKVLRVGNGYVGFQNGIYWDTGTGHCSSAIRMITSLDGYTWDYNASEPFLKPEPGWKKAFVYALDIRQVGERFYLYFNARDGWLLGKERIGLAFGTGSG